MEELQNLTRVLYDTGKKMGKMVVATGDSHFIDPQDDVYRRILQSGMGYGLERQAPLYFKTTDELKSDFAYFDEETIHELVVTNPRRVADQDGRCGTPAHPDPFAQCGKGRIELLTETATAKAEGALRRNAAGIYREALEKRTRRHHQ